MVERSPHRTFEPRSEAPGPDAGARGPGPTAPRAELIQESGGLRATRLPGLGTRLVVVFNSIGGTALRQAAPGEFSRLLASDPANRLIFLSDLTQGWFASGSMMRAVTDLVGAEAERTGASEIVSLGSSMGGFAALALAEFLPVRAALAFSPRYSPDDAIVPDARLVDHRAACAPFTPQTVEAGLAAAPFSVVIHGLRGKDRRHVERFPAQPGMRHYLIPGVAHAVAAFLYKHRTLGGVLSAALAQRGADLDAIMLRAGAFSRVTPQPTAP
ncbi:MAG: hypothetical protein AAFR46_00785 [Pseudomonadota bacterium]